MISVNYFKHCFNNKKYLMWLFVTKKRAQNRFKAQKSKIFQFFGRRGLYWEGLYYVFVRTVPEMVR